MPRRAPVDLDALMDRACELARTHGGVPRAQMKTFRPHLAELGPRLIERGLEIGTTIRVPLETQLLALAEKGFVPLKGLDRKLSGANARDTKLVVEGLVANGKLAWVVRDAGVGVVTPSTARLEASEVQTLLVTTTKLAKLLKSAARAKKGLLHADVATFASVFVDSAATSPRGPSPPRARTDSHTAPSPTPSGADLVQEILRRIRGAAMPTHVPALLRSMGLDADSGRRALLDGVARGLFELEPESGMGRLSREDADLCPPGPMGTRLSWVRARNLQGARS